MKRLYLDNGEVEAIRDIYDFADVLNSYLGRDFREFLLNYVEEQQYILEDVIIQYSQILGELEDNFKDVKKSSNSSEELAHDLTTIIKDALSETRKVNKEMDNYFEN